MQQTSYIEISKSAYRHNIQYLKKIIGSNVKLSAVVKGNAYGHGVENIVPLAEKAGVNHFSVFSAAEALEVFKVKSDKSKIMIMGYLSDEQIAWAIENGIEFYVFDLYRLTKAIELAKSIGKPAKIHIEVETGFNRTGIEFEELPQVTSVMHENLNLIEFVGLCTHYAGAETIANHLRVMNQIEIYNSFYEYFLLKDLVPKYRHTAASAATLTYPQTRMDMVRVGIAQYGFWPTQETLIHQIKENNAKESDLRRVISWKTHIMSIKNVEPGEFVGYGISYMANRKTKVAILPIGYSNGYSRSLSNSGRVLIHGKQAPVVGSVTMNTLSVNVTDIPNVNQGDEVVLIGKQKRECITVASFSDMSNQLNYQVLARLPGNIPRNVVS
ncbi:alanine racemase [Tenuifilum thalassicum]|uniref:Alanine racemase n=1 Tax=Tenuifilum thalassicum TaxID=2590900 RepID=A0A7D4BFP9_9BACT|nr:alanine racemase [Tenuifilum thalassicum]QKG80818.1 alanine racemase [Tenuifilum thalassicum]